MTVTMQTLLSTVNKPRLTESELRQLARQSGLPLAYMRQLVHAHGIAQVRAFCEGLQAGDDRGRA